MQRRNRAFSVGVLLATLSVSGCGGGASAGGDSASPAPAPTRTAEPDRAASPRGRESELPAANEARTELERARVQSQLKFARCMREQGLDYPDPRPNPDGSYFHEPPEDPAARAAYDRAGAVCVKHFDAIADIELTPAERRELAEAIDRDRAIARCMRAKGYRWPDPIPDEGGFRTDEIEAAGIDPDDPRLQAHERDCLRRAGQPVTP